ncbi:hypothetical protein MRX96_032633 [Rhipicephalus microplus]
MRNRNQAFADAPQGDQPQYSVISVLIGSNQCWKIVIGQVERFTDTLCAVETIFGWVIFVGANVNHWWSLRNISANALFLACSDKWWPEDLPKDTSDVWRLDAIGITDEQDDFSKHPALVQFCSTDLNSELAAVCPTAVSAQGMHPPTPLLDFKKYSSLTRLLRSSSSSQLHVGDFVVVRDDNVPALQWKLGTVVEAFPGRDGLERYLKIAFPNSQQVGRATQR